MIVRALLRARQCRGRSFRGLKLSESAIGQMHWTKLKITCWAAMLAVPIALETTWLIHCHKAGRAARHRRRDGHQRTADSANDG